MPLDQQTVIRAVVAERDRLYAYIWSMLGDAHLAEDVLQDVTVVAIEKATELADERVLVSWLRTTARYKSFEALRAKKRRPPVMDAMVLDQLESAWEALDLLEVSELADNLERCLGRLTPRSRQIVAMRYGNSMKSGEIAEALGRKVSSVYQVLTRAHRVLADCIRHAMRTEPGISPNQDSKT